MRTLQCVLFALLCLMSTSVLAQPVHQSPPHPSHHMRSPPAHVAPVLQHVRCWHRVTINHHEVWRYHTVLAKHVKCPRNYYRYRNIPHANHIDSVQPVAILYHPERRWQPASVLHMESSELACLATALYRESRGESVKGNIAVAYVIVNRTKDPRFPTTICGVINQGKHSRSACQFSWACHPPRGKIDTVYYRRAQHIADLVMRGATPDPVGKALYFHELSVRGRPSRLARYHRRIGHHIFYAQYPITDDLAAR